MGPGSCGADSPHLLRSLVGGGKGTVLQYVWVGCGCLLEVAGWAAGWANRPAPPRDCRAPWGRARLHPETAWPGAGPRALSRGVSLRPCPAWGLFAAHPPRASPRVSAESPGRKGWCRAGGGAGAGPRRPPLMRSGLGDPGEPQRAVMTPPRRREGAARPPAQPRLRSPLRRGRVCPACGFWPCRDRDPTSPTPNASCFSYPRPDCPWARVLLRVRSHPPYAGEGRSF